MTTPTPSTARRSLTVLIATALALPSGMALAQPFPGKPLTLISPFAAGGTSDAVARAAGRLLEQDIGQPVVVVNRPGAGGTLGVGSSLAPPTDGYTMVMGGLGSIVFPAVVHKGQIKYDPVKDLTPIGLIGVAPTVIVVGPRTTASSLKELVAAAKASPGKLTYGSAGVGGTFHLAGVLLERDAQITLSHIPYRGGVPALTDLASGTLDLAFADLTVAAPFIKGGRVRAIAIASTQRSAMLPDVQTTAEAGLPGVKMDTWYALFMPASAPAATLKKMKESVAAVQKKPELGAALIAQGISPSSGTLPQFETELKRDFDTWLPILARICSENRCE